MIFTIYYLSSDLSSTSLVAMPSVGLQNIEALYIQNTHTLKTIPSIYNFRVSKVPTSS